MDFLHAEFQGGERHLAVVSLTGPANVMLLDDVSFAAYVEGRPFRYHGGWASGSPVRLRPPRYGTWHVVVDLGGGSGTVRASVHVVRTDPQLSLL